jgi:sugar/nucleoside kinase (ribokinase family)
MRPLASRVDVIIANEEDIQACLGLEVHGADVAPGAWTAGYRDVAARVKANCGSRSPSRCARATSRAQWLERRAV